MNKYFALSLFLLLTDVGADAREFTIYIPKVVKVDFLRLKLCLKAMPGELKVRMNREHFEKDHFPRGYNEDEKRHMIEYIMDINNYSCGITEYDHDVYAVSMEARFSGIIYEQSQWYDKNTYKFLGWHLNNPREKDKMAINKEKWKERNIPAEFLDQCGSFINQMEEDMRQRYSSEKKVSPRLADISNYEIVIIENEFTYDVLLLQKEPDYYFDNTHNNKYVVKRKGCRVIEKISSKAIPVQMQ